MAITPPNARRRFAEDTKVPAMQSRQEIERLLERHRCAQFGTAVDYEKLLAQVQFKAHGRLVRFRVPLPDPKKFPRDDKRSQEERRVWRALLLVIKAKLESADSGIETFESAFLAQIVLPNDATTYEVMRPLISDAYTRGLMPKLLPSAPEGSK
jgi:hypothetical protein